MKNPFVIFLCVYIMLYFVGWYVSFEPNILSWDITGRAIHIWFTFVTTIILVIANAENER